MMTLKKLAPEMKEKWAWDRERPDPKLFADYPRFEMRALVEKGQPGQLRAKL